LTDKCGAVLSYGDASHPSAVTNHSTLGKNYTYDQNGNMLTRGQPDPPLDRRQPGGERFDIGRRHDLDGVRLQRHAGQKDRAGRDNSVSVCRL
jgi:hypothetical protein